jgi:hypothetical protein
MISQSPSYTELTQRLNYLPAPGIAAEARGGLYARAAEACAATAAAAAFTASSSPR